MTLKEEDIKVEKKILKPVTTALPVSKELDKSGKKMQSSASFKKDKSPSPTKTPA